jgi:hypothetical protein
MSSYAVLQVRTVQAWLGTGSAISFPDLTLRRPTRLLPGEPHLRIRFWTVWFPGLYGLYRLRKKSLCIRARL